LLSNKKSSLVPPQGKHLKKRRRSEEGVELDPVVHGVKGWSRAQTKTGSSEAVVFTGGFIPSILKRGRWGKGRHPLPSKKNFPMRGKGKAPQKNVYLSSKKEGDLHFGERGGVGGLVSSFRKKFMKSVASLWERITKKRLPPYHKKDASSSLKGATPEGRRIKREKENRTCRSSLGGTYYYEKKWTLTLIGKKGEVTGKKLIFPREKARRPPCLNLSWGGGGVFFSGEKKE